VLRDNLVFLPVKKFTQFGGLLSVVGGFLKKCVSVVAATLASMNANTKAKQQHRQAH